MPLHQGPKRRVISMVAEALQQLAVGRLLAARGTASPTARTPFALPLFL
jgi:hypothetical protein